MVELDFEVEGARFEPYSVSPLMLFRLRVRSRTPELRIQNLAVQCQVRIEPTRRQYDGREPDRLLDLFGAPGRWGETLTGFLWTHAAVSVPAFETERSVDLPVPCSYDFNVAATKYFYALANGDAPLALLFSGSVFYKDPDGRLQIEQIPWTKEAHWRLPVATWQAMIDHHYPDGAWLRLEREVFERLYAFKRRRGLPSWEQAIGALLEGQPAETVP